MSEDDCHFLLHCSKYSIPREKFYSQIQHNFVDSNQLSSTELLIKLKNSQNFSLNSHFLKFVSLRNDLRNNLLSSHADDTWLTTVIIALSLLWFVCLFVCFYIKAFAILQLHNYSHANKAYVVVVVAFIASLFTALVSGEPALKHFSSASFVLKNVLPE